MNMKKLIATALAVVMIFGLVSVGFAAAPEFPDLEGYEFEDEVRRLASLGVIAGYPDGTFRPEEAVTRAEFAKMIVVMLGLENAANLMKGQAVSFSDVPATHWASGYINVAEMKGVVNGYPDGTFKPEGAITYAEALKMILTAMGYHEEGFLVLRWPTTWIIQAAEIGLDEDVEILANLRITRGEVAKLFDNSLTKPHVKIGEYGFEVIGGEDTEKQVTFMRKLGVKSLVGQVVDSPELWDNTSGKVKVQPTTGASMEFTTEAYEGLLGHRVQVWYKSATNVLAIDDLSTEKTLSAKDYNKITDKTKLEFFVNYVKRTADIVVSGVVYDHVVKNADEIVVVYTGSTPIAVKALKYDTGIVSETYVYGTSRKDIYFKEGGKLSLATYSVEYKGAVKEFSEIKKGDVIHYITYDAAKPYKALLVVVRDSYSGTVTALTTDVKIKVDDKVFAFAEDYEVSDPSELGAGAVVTVYLNKDGEVYYVEVEKEYGVSSTFYGVVQSTEQRLVKGIPTYFATILTIDGEADYEHNGSLIVGNVVYGVIGTGGTVTYTHITGSDVISGTVQNVNATTKKIEVGGVEYTYTADTLWLEGDEAPYDVRPVRPYKDDTVTLYKHGGVIVVGIVE